MSRNFELLERVQQEREIFNAPPITKPVSGSTPSQIELADLDVFAREEVLRLVQRLFLASSERHHRPIRRVVFCGIESREASIAVCARVGRSLAEQVQSKICIIDASCRVPTDRPILEVAPLSESTNIRKHLQRVTANLWLVPNGSVAANGDVPSLDQVRAFIRDLGEEFPYTLISAPPVGSYNDVVLLGSLADGVVLVLEANSTRRMTALRAKRALEAADVRVLGTVLNNRTFPIPERVYRWL